MKKVWLKRAGIMLLVLGLLLGVADVGLHVLSGRAWVRRKITEKLSQAIGREIRLDRVVFNLRGGVLENFVIAKPGGFAEGEMFRIGHAHMKVSLWHLLHGELHISAVGIEGISLHIVRDEQGKLNTEFYPEEPKIAEDSAGTPPDIAVEELIARKIEITYLDKQTQLQAELKDAEISLRNFSWDEPFEVRAQAALAYQQDKQPFSAKMSLGARVLLAELDLPKAYAEISSFSFRNGSMRATLTGQVKNLENPEFDLKLDGQKISHQALAPFVSEDWPLDIARLSILAKGVLSPADGKLQLAQGEFSCPGIETTLQGEVNWKREKYDISLRLQAQLGELAQALLFLRPYAPEGRLVAEGRVTSKITVRAEMADGGFHVPQAGKFTNLQAALDVSENTLFTKGQGVFGLHGTLNGEDFKTDFSFTQTAKEIVATLHAAAEKLILPPAKKEESSSDKAALSAAAEEEKFTWKWPPITAKADVKIGALDAPYINGQEFDFQLDMSGITPRLDSAHGTLALSMNNGQITDLYHLTNSNALMKVLFMSLNVVGKVFNSLDVMSVLSGLTGSSPNGQTEAVIKMIPNEEGKLVAVRVPASSRKVDGHLAYDKFVTDVHFEHGVATIKKGSFVSDMMSFDLSGTTDFKTEKIDMTVQAAPGRHETGGVMPLTLKIGGTIREPTGNMSVMGSVASLVTQGVTNNFASRAIKKSLRGFWGLFKKKERPLEETSKEEISSQSAAEPQ